jgi:hypothetical protein
MDKLNPNILQDLEIHPCSPARSKLMHPSFSDRDRAAWSSFQLMVKSPVMLSGCRKPFSEKTMMCWEHSSRISLLASDV